MDTDANPPTPTPPPTGRKRPRPNRPVVHPTHATPGFPATLLALSGVGLRVTLSQPDDGEICPLTLSLIAEDALEFLPGVTFFTVLSHIRRMTLPCGHAFGAMSVVYHFARQGMACPLCRAGPRPRICADSIPHHFRTQMIREVNTQHLREIEEQTTADAAVARELEAEEEEESDDAGAQGLVFIDFERIFVSVYYHTAGNEIPSLGMQFRLQLDPTEEDATETHSPFRFFIPFADRRLLAIHISEYAPELISLVAHARVMANHPIELGRTAPFDPTPVAGGVPRIIQGGRSQFEFHQLQNPYSDQSLRWVVPAAAFVSMMMLHDSPVIEVS